MGNLRKQNKGGIKSKKVEDGIRKAGRGCGRWMTGSLNVEADR
jgi:hypothetical protein